jgi:hypothetical protein
MRIFLLAFVLLIIHVDPVTAQWQQARGVIHLDTTVSGGDYTPSEMAKFLKENDIEVGVFTDHDTVKFDYGFFPTRWLIGKMTGWAIASAFGRTESVQSFGAEVYVARIKELNAETDGVILLPGVEAIPFFYWEGSLLFNTLGIHNAYKHLLAFGFDDPGDYTSIPSVGNGFYRSFGTHSLLSLWPVGLIFLVFQIFKATTNSPLRGLIKTVGIFLIVLSGLFLTQNFSYAFTRYDQYHGDQGVAPYQDFIDYVTEKNGVVFWAHPEIEVNRVIQNPPLKVTMKTAPYHSDLLYTQNYTGFSAFHEGMKHIIPPGAIWDRVLNEYAEGKRDRPIWAIAEGDVEGDAFSPQFSETVFMLKERTQADVIDALKEGRIYAVGGPNSHFFNLETFEIASDLNKAASGQTLRADSKDVTVTAKLTFNNPEEKRKGIQATLIRDGEPVGNFKGVGTLVLSFKEIKNLNPDRIHYYRVDASAPNQTRLLSNPVFLAPGS